MTRLTVTMALLAGPAFAQSTIEVETLEPNTGSQVIIIQPQHETEIFSLQKDLGTVHSDVSVPAAVAEGATLRGLDKLSGEVADFELDNGYSIMFGGLRVDLGQCRYPEDNATGEAYAFLTIHEGREASLDPVFQGWMIASSPALNALDHARYDIWVLRCKATAEPEGN